MNRYHNICDKPIDKGKIDWLKYCDWGKFVPILYVSTTGGLCNRLFGIASCWPKAIKENRSVKVYWPLNGDDGTSVLWTDLFENPLDMFSEWDLYWMMDVMHEVKWYQEVEHAYNQVDTSNLVLVKSYYDYFNIHKSDIFDMSFSVKWLNSLTVKPHILEKVNSFGLKPNTLGIHLRVKEDHFAGDNLFNENPITDSLLNDIHTWPNQVLIVSNSAEAKNRIVSIFGDKIVVQDNLEHSRSSNATQSALVDLILLSMCSKRIGNRASTFFGLANIWSQRTF
jgi:hypothetical protein